MVFTYNLPGVDRLRLSPTVLADVFSSEILRWDDPRVVADNPGVTRTVRSAPGGITYMEESFALSNQLPTAQLRNGAGEYVAPEPGPVSAALAAATTDTSKGDVRVSIDFRSTARGIYPASAVAYAIVCDRGNSNPAGLRAFLGYAVTRGQQSAAPLGYAPLPEPLKREASARLAKLG